VHIIITSYLLSVCFCCFLCLCLMFLLSLSVSLHKSITQLLYSSQPTLVEKCIIFSTILSNTLLYIFRMLIDILRTYRSISSTQSHIHLYTIMYVFMYLTVTIKLHSTPVTQFY
jgi:hypothetical protein